MFAYKIKSKLLFLCFFIIVLFSSWKTIDNYWISKKCKNYNIEFTSKDKKNTKEYKKLIDKGITSVKAFFGSSYKNEFQVFIHPNRQSLDSTWQKDWGMPTFKSECWMVASGVGKRLDMISPKIWDTQSCEHKYAETNKTQQLITHELIHVFHGQLNASSDFSTSEGIDWFVEGLATYASGQCDASRIAEVKKAIIENKIPNSLDNFWTGKIKYGLSGSIVMYIDFKYGRNKLKEMLPLSKKSEILTSLNTTETELLENWKKYILSK